MATRPVLSAILVLATVVAAVCAEVTGKAPVLELNDGKKIPQFGLGTWLGFQKAGGLVKPTGTEVKAAVEWAIDAGYRHIDTAFIYDTEGQVGAAIKEKIRQGVVKREDLFVTTKLWNDKHARDAVVPALRESLKKLDLEYVDLYLIHWPIGHYPNVTYDDTDYVDTWKGMVEARELGLARSVGVCNFNQEQLERLMASSPVKPAVLQVELNLNLQQPELRAFCKSKGIVMMAYTPFGSLFPDKAAADAPPPRVSDPELKTIADKYKKTVPQIVLRYLVELGVIPIPKSITKKRVEANIDIFDFSLTPEEKAKLKSYDKHYRTIAVKFWASSKDYPFEKN